MRRQAIVNVGSNWATLVVATVVSFFLSPFVVSRLGSETYGAWTLLGSLVGYLGLIDLGVRGAVTKFVATAHAAGEHDEAGHITSAGLTFFGIAALVAIGISGGVAPFVDRMFAIPTELVVPARWAFFLTGIAVAVSIVGGVFGGVIVALHRFDHLNVVEVGVTLVRAAATIIALQRGGGLVALTVIQLVASIVRTGIYYRSMRALYPALRLHLSGVWQRIPQIMTFGLVSTGIQVSGMLINYSDSIIIGLFLPLQAVAFFAIGSTLIQQARGLVAGVSQIVAPMAASLEGSGDLARVGELLLTSARLATLVIMPVVAAFMISGETFIGLWMGMEFAEPSGRVLRILAPGLAVLASFQVTTSMMMGINRHLGMVRVFALEAVANVLLCVALVRPLGITGVALGILLPRLAVCLGFGPGYAHVVLGVSIADYWRQTLLRPALAIVPFAVACEVVEVWWPATNLWLFLVQIAALLPLAVLGAWGIALDPHERAMVQATVDARWRSLRLGRGPRSDEG